MIPVAVGCDYAKPHKPQDFEYDIPGWTDTRVPWTDGKELFLKVLRDSAPKSLIVAGGAAAAAVQPRRP